MKRFLLTSAFLMACAGCALAAPAAPADDESKTVTIPLDQIWAYDMPGTRDTGQLEPNKPAKLGSGPLVGEILRALAVTPAEGKEARPGFAVLGTGLEAIREAHAVLVDNSKPRQAFPTGGEVSVVFFSYEAGSYVYLNRVERGGNVVEIYYRFVPHRTMNLTSHFAIIPLGALPAGKIYVKILQSPLEQEYTIQGFRPVTDAVSRQIVCRSFSFSVVQNDPSEQQARPKLVTIPLDQIITTSPQKGLEHVRDVFHRKNDDQGAEVFLRQLHDVSHGSSNVFLVDATNMSDALSAGFSILAGSGSADTPAHVTTSNPKQDSYWLVAYLGTGPSNPTWWTVEQVAVSSGSIVLTYRKSKPAPATDDLRHYYCWVPLGRLDAGAYEVQLLDAEQGAVTLMRRIEVTPVQERKE
jgi:hypothetical protein